MAQRFTRITDCLTLNLLSVFAKKGVVRPLCYHHFWLAARGDSYTSPTPTPRFQTSGFFLIYSKTTMLTETLSPVQAVAAVFCIYFSSWIIYCRYFHPLHAVPGPFLASISRSWIVWKTMSGDMEHTQRALHKKHGKSAPEIATLFRLNWLT